MLVKKGGIKLSEKQNNQTVNKGCLIGCGGLIGIFLIIFLFAAFADFSNNRAKDKAADKAVDTSLPLEERIEHAVFAAVGKETTNGEVRNIRVDIEENIVIKLEGDVSTFSKKDTIWFLQDDVRDIWEQLSKMDDLYGDIEISLETNFVDAYGNKTKNTAMTVIIPSEELKKINFDNFYTDNVPKIATVYTLHPSFLK